MTDNWIRNYTLHFPLGELNIYLSKITNALTYLNTSNCKERLDYLKIQRDKVILKEYSYNLKLSELKICGTEKQVEEFIQNRGQDINDKVPFAPDKETLSEILNKAKTDLESLLIHYNNIRSRFDYCNKSELENECKLLFTRYLELTDNNSWVATIATIEVLHLMKEMDLSETTITLQLEEIENYIANR